MAQKQYWLMDGRANYDVDAAYVLECCSSLEEAKRNINDYGADTCIVDSETQEVVESLMWRGLTLVAADGRKAAVKKGSDCGKGSAASAHR